MDNLRGMWTTQDAAAAGVLLDPAGAALLEPLDDELLALSLLVDGLLEPLDSAFFSAFSPFSPFATAPERLSVR